MNEMLTNTIETINIMAETAFTSGVIPIRIIPKI